MKRINKDISDKKVNYTYVIQDFLFESLQKYLFSKGYEWLDSGKKIIKNQYYKTVIYINCWENKAITFNSYSVEDNRCSTSHKYIYNYDRILKMKRINETS